MIQKLSDLREPPIVGQFYMVPVVRGFPYYGRVDTWPVIGAMHSDAEFFNFHDLHYHLDARFLTKAQVKHIVTDYRGLEAWVGGSPLANRAIPLPKGRAELARKKCRSDVYRHAHQTQRAVIALNKHYSAPVEPLRLADGRLLCPHRKADLSSFPVDAEGMVICPLHGLKVCVRPPAAPA